MKRKIIAALFALIFTAALPVLANAKTFTDVQSKSWYYAAVNYVVDNGLFDGTSPTSFSPKGTFTRGMIVKVLGDMDGIDTSKYPGSRFADVKPDSWYAPYVEWAVENNITDGTASRFDPNREVTREQMAIIFYNYAEYAGCDISTRGGLLEQFSDGDRVSKDARYAMMWALTHGVLNGSGNKLDPQGTTTRAQVAQIFYNSRELFRSKSGKPAGTPAPDTNTPRITISDAVRAQLKPNQDPDLILEYVLNGKHDDSTFSFEGTTAKWDPTLPGQTDMAKYYWGSWDEDEKELYSSSSIGNCFQMKLTRTASDRFYIIADEEINCFLMYYHPANTVDSALMKEVKAALRLPDTKRESRPLCYEGAGWAGPMSMEWYDTPGDIAGMIEYYLCEFHPYTTEYYITEPEPGVFYLLYG